VAQNGTSRSKKQPRRSQNGRRRSVLVRVLIGLLIVLVVGGLSFLIGYLIGLQLGVVVPF
jgi:hypothetical protein